MKDDLGREIHGLSATPFKRDADDNIIAYRYYATFSKPKEWFSTDRHRAIFLFRQWLARQTKERVRFVAVDREELLESQLDMQAEYFWAKARELILGDPHFAASKLGIPEIAHLEHLKPPPPSPTLESIGEQYYAKADIKPHELRKSKRYWTEFVGAVSAKTLRELSAEQVRAQP